MDNLDDSTANCITLQGQPQMCKGEALPSAHRCRDRRDFVAGIKEGSIAKNGLFRQAHAEHPIRQNGCIDAHVPDEFLGLLYRTLFVREAANTDIRYLLRHGTKYGLLSALARPRWAAPLPFIDRESRHCTVENDRPA